MGFLKELSSSWLRKRMFYMARENFDVWGQRLSLAVLLWLCSLPLVFVLGMVLGDVRVGWIGSAVSFTIIVLVCMVICVRRLSLDDVRKESLGRRQ